MYILNKYIRYLNWFIIDKYTLRTIHKTKFNYKTVDTEKVLS